MGLFAYSHFSFDLNHIPQIVPTPRANSILHVPPGAADEPMSEEGGGGGIRGGECESFLDERLVDILFTKVLVCTFLLSCKRDLHR